MSAYARCDTNASSVSLRASGPIDNNSPSDATHVTAAARTPPGDCGNPTGTPHDAADGAATAPRRPGRRR